MVKHNNKNSNMVDQNFIKNIEQQIKLQTVDLSIPEYAEFMRRLSAWAEDEANIAEYEPDFDFEED